MSKKLTPWFPPEVKPTHEGVYLTRRFDFTHDGVFRKFASGVWHVLGNTSEDAATQTEARQRQNNLEWRGLAKEPK